LQTVELVAGGKLICKFAFGMKWAQAGVSLCGNAISRLRGLLDFSKPLRRAYRPIDLLLR